MVGEVVVAQLIERFEIESNHRQTFILNICILSLLHHIHGIAVNSTYSDNWNVKKDLPKITAILVQILSVNQSC